MEIQADLQNNTMPDMFGMTLKDAIYVLENYGLNIVKKENKIIVDNLKWNGLAKKSGFELDDLISEIKVENLNRPSKNFVYPIALLLFLIFGYLNKRRINN